VTTSTYLRYEWALWIALYAVFSILFLSFTVDDAYISFRYGYNLIHHGIWNWNPDHDYVEAYTSGLYTFLAIVPLWLGISPILFFKIIGVSCLARLVWRVRSLCTDPHTRFVFTLFLLANSYTYIHTYSCLETPLFMVLCMELFAWLAENRSDVRRFYCLLLLLPLTRPDGGLLSVFAFAYYLWRRHSHIERPAFLAGIITLGIAYFSWRYWYFGYLLPNTFYAKQMQQITFSSILVKLALSIFYLGTICSLMMWIKQRDFRFIGLTALITYALAYLPSASWMNYADRFAFQLFVPAILASAYYVQSFSKQDFYKVCAALALIIIMIDCDTDTITGKMIYGPKNYYTNRALGEKFSTFQDKHYTLMSTDVGALPYYSGWKTYDAFGLANATIAHQGNSLGYMQSISPDVMMLTAIRNGAAGDENWESQIVTDYHQDVAYTYVKSSHLYQRVSFVPFNDHYYYIVFLKKDLPDFEALRHIVSDVAAQANTLNRKSVMEITDPLIGLDL